MSHHKKIPKEENLKCQKLVDLLVAEPLSEAFREPVDWKGLRLNSHPQIIKKPMDLHTIKNKLKKSRYGTVQDFLSDLELIWLNC